MIQPGWGNSAAKQVHRAAVGWARESPNRMPLIYPTDFLRGQPAYRHGSQLMRHTASLVLVGHLAGGQWSAVRRGCCAALAPLRSVKKSIFWATNFRGTLRAREATPLSMWGVG